MVEDQLENHTMAMIMELSIHLSKPMTYSRTFSAEVILLLISSIIMMDFSHFQDRTETIDNKDKRTDNEFNWAMDWKGSLTPSGQRLRSHD